MSFNGSGLFQINSSGQPVTSGTAISATVHNALTADLAAGLSTAICKDGQTTTSARIPFALGINSTLTTDSTSTSTGSILTAGGIGCTKALWVGGLANIAGALTVTGHLTLEGVTSTGATGTGKLVFDTSPTFVTPVLGTPSSGNLSNCTALPLGSITGFAANVAAFLATPSSANLASAVTNETGSGALVFANTPTLVTPELGAATGTSLVLSGALTCETIVNLGGQIILGLTGSTGAMLINTDTDEISVQNHNNTALGNLVVNDLTVEGVLTCDGVTDTLTVSLLNTMTFSNGILVSTT